MLQGPDGEILLQPKSPLGLESSWLPMPSRMMSNVRECHMPHHSASVCCSDLPLFTSCLSLYGSPARLRWLLTMSLSSLSLGSVSTTLFPTPFTPTRQPVVPQDFTETSAHLGSLCWPVQSWFRAFLHSPEPPVISLSTPIIL